MDQTIFGDMFSAINTYLFYLSGPECLLCDPVAFKIERIGCKYYAPLPRAGWVSSNIIDTGHETLIKRLTN